MTKGDKRTMKTIFAVQDPEFGWVGFQTAEEAGTGAIQVNCYENLAEFNEAKLEKVRQDALAKLTDVEIEALGLEKFKVAGPTRTQTVPSKVVAPGSEVTRPAPIVKVPLPEKEKEYYGFLVLRYRNYDRAIKMQEKMKKGGVFGFIQPALTHPDLFELWAGPFSDLGEARTAERSLRDLLKVPRKIHKIDGTIPK
jgi:cell division septation protein DedD